MRAAETAEQVNGRRRTGPPYTVRVFDLYHFMDEREEIDIPGFSTLGHAREYARRRTRDSLEEYRAPSMAMEDVRQHWLTFGEDCVVLDDGYRDEEGSLLKRCCGMVEYNGWIAELAAGARTEKRGEWNLSDAAT